LDSMSQTLPSKRDIIAIFFDDWTRVVRTGAVGE